MKSFAISLYKRQAIDDDAFASNGAVRYEIVRGNYESKFQIDELTGEF